MNRWGIPRGLEERVKARDRLCVYCRVVMRRFPRSRGVPANKATWEHIDNDGPASAANIVLCCEACNTSKGTKDLVRWFESDYCVKKNISAKTVSMVVKKWLRKARSR